MNQTQENGMSQGAYLERLLQEQHQQYQQNIQQQFQDDKNGNENVNKNGGINVNNNQSVGIGRPVGSPLFYFGNSVTKSPAMAISNSMGIGINQQQQQQQQHHQHQQNRMMTFLQERQQQQFFLANSIVGGPSDLSSNLGISGLSTNVGLDSRGGSGIGSGISSSAWIDGLSSGGLGTGMVANTGGSLYSTEQDLLLSSQRYPTLGGSMGGNRLTTNGGGNGSFGDVPLTSALGRLPQFSLPHQTLASSQPSLNAHQKPKLKSIADILLAKQAEAVFLQAAQSHLPRTIRLPCSARGMKADHNSTNSYFDVPVNARHGQHLLCSHIVCRAAGVKFRYCFYCKKPVTKQNFRSRHLHANLDPNHKKKEEKVADRKKRKSKDKVETKKSMDIDTSKSTSNKKIFINTSEENFKRPVTDDDEKDSIESLVTLPINNSEKEGCCDGTEYCLERPSKICKLSNSDEGKLCRRQNRWEELLDERPSDDQEAIHSWTGKILSVSNPEMNSSKLGTPDKLELQKQQQQDFHLNDLSLEGLTANWNFMLDRRPKGNNNSSSVTNWLSQALELSDKYKKIKKLK